jgi:hypothetical protein
MSTLPEEFERETIERMLPGDEGFTEPWAMYAETDRTLWINGRYLVRPQPAGTAHLKIKRTSKGVIVYKDTIGDCRYTPAGPGGDVVPVAIAVELK